MRKYPDTEYADSAKQKIEVGRDQLAAKEMAIGRYYLEKKNFIGAINRFKIVVTQYQTTRHVEEALDAADRRLHGARHRQGGADRGRRARAQFPRQPLVQGRLQAGEVRRLRAAENKGSWISKAFKKIGEVDYGLADRPRPSFPCMSLAGARSGTPQRGLDAGHPHHE